MAVKVTIGDADNNSDEYNAALKLKRIIQEGLLEKADGEVVMYASATLIGQAVKDVDILLIGNLRNYNERIAVIDRESGDYYPQDVWVRSFCTVIEIKKHDAAAIMLKGTDWYVRYGRSLHSVTQQSNKQRISAMNFFKQTLNYSPYITNVIWFTQASNKDIKSLLKTDEHSSMLSNVLGSDFTLKTQYR